MKIRIFHVFCYVLFDDIGLTWVETSFLLNRDRENLRGFVSEISSSFPLSASSNISCLVKPREVWLAEHIRSTYSLREKQKKQSHRETDSSTVEDACVYVSHKLSQVFKAQV